MIAILYSYKMFNNEQSNPTLHEAQFKTKVVLKALKGAGTLAQPGSGLGIHALMITGWS